MNRRDFLKCGAAAIAAAALPAAALNTPTPDPQMLGRIEGVQFFPHFPARRAEGNWITPDDVQFDPSHYYGNGFALTYQPANLDVEEELLGKLYEDMCRVIPPSFREQVLLHGRRDDFNNGFTLAWKYYPA